MTTQELKTETARLAAEVRKLYFATDDARILPRARHEIFCAVKHIEYALEDLESAPPDHGRLGEHDVRD